jgi:hypothetical protein
MDRCGRAADFTFTPWLTNVVKVALNNWHIFVNGKKVKEFFFFSNLKQDSYNKYLYISFYIPERSFMYITVPVDF